MTRFIASLLAQLWSRSTFPGARPCQPSPMGRAVRRPSGHVPRLEELEVRAVPSANFSSALGLGSAGNDLGHDVATDAAGNVYVTGRFTGTVDFDPAVTHTGNADILTSRGTMDNFVAKYSAAGSLAWALRIARDDGSDASAGIALDGSGNVYVSGQFRGVADFGPYTLTSTGWSVATSTGYADAFVAKLDPNGNVLWAKGHGEIYNDSMLSVAVDAAGNVYTAGVYVTGQLNKNGSGLQSDVEVTKFDAGGTLLWVKRLGGIRHDRAEAVAVDGAGNVYVAGRFADTVDFDPGPGSFIVQGLTAMNGFVLKLSTNGDFAWVSAFVGVKVHGAIGSAGCNGLALDVSGNIYAGGSFNGPLDFDPGPGTYILTGLSDWIEDNGFVVKLTTNGSLLWARQFGDAFQDLALDTTGNVYVTGGLSGTHDFDPGPGTLNLTSSGPQDVFVAKLDAGGNLVWAVAMGGSGNDWGAAVSVDSVGNVYVVGSFEGTADFDPDPVGSALRTSAGGWDIFLVRLTQS